MPPLTTTPKLTKPRTASYKPQPIDHWGLMPRDLPIFTWLMIREMLWDPTIRLGLAMREAPLHGAELAYREGENWQAGVKCENKIVALFVQKQLERFWKHDLAKVLRAQVWGWAGGEVTYKLNKLGQVEYAGLLQRASGDIRALELEGKQIGVRFRRIPATPKGYVDLRFPECFWHPFGAEDGSHYGNSVLRGCYSPWCDKYLDGMALDVRRLFMHKDAYGGVDISYPPGSMFVEGQGNITNQDIARQMASQVKAGGVTTRPSTCDANGHEQWVITRATIPANPQHILQYPKDLDVEILRGLEIPDDVLTSEGMTGAWAGKAVPQQAFYAGLDKWLTSLANDFQVQIAQPLIWWNFDQCPDFEIGFKPLAEQASEQSGDKEQGGGGPIVNPFAPVYQQMSLAEQAVGEGVLSATQLVKAARRVMRNGHHRNGYQRMASAHAPKGGVTLKGKRFVGGEFIPGATQEEVDKAAAEQSDEEPKAESSFTSHRKAWAAAVYTAVQQHFDTGKPVYITTTTKRWKLEPKHRDSLRFKDGIQLRNGKNWDRVQWQALETLAAYVGVPEPEIEDDISDETPADTTDEDAQNERWSKFVENHFDGQYAKAGKAMEAAGFADDKTDQFIAHLMSGPLDKPNA